MSHDFPENVESVPAYLCIYGKNEEVLLTRKGLQVLEAYAEIQSLKFMEGGALVRVGELSEPLPIIKARMSEASEEEIGELQRERQQYLLEVSSANSGLVKAQSAN